MSDELQGAPADNWPQNYFNYFTEIEDHFQRARGTGLFLLSPVDWALIENWKNAGIPLQAVLRGIDDAFEKWRSRKSKRRMINSLLYCAQAVAEAAGRVSSRAGFRTAEVLFSPEELRRYLENAAAQVRGHNESQMQEIASSVNALAAGSEQYVRNLEDLERRLTALEGKMTAVLRATADEETLYAIRESLDGELRPYRGKMSAEQLSMLEHRYIDAALLERAKLPRLSLFYLR